MKYIFNKSVGVMLAVVVISLFVLFTTLNEFLWVIAFFGLTYLVSPYIEKRKVNGTEAEKKLLTILTQDEIDE